MKNNRHLKLLSFRFTLVTAVIMCLVCGVGCYQVEAPNPASKPSKAARLPTQTGLASFYSDSLHGSKTASGQVYNKNEFTAAHRSYPLGTKVRVYALDSGASVDVIVNDRGPFKRTRVIDLSMAAAKKLGLIQRGVAKVRLEPLT